MKLNDKWSRSLPKLGRMAALLPAGALALLTGCVQPASGPPASVLTSEPPKAPVLVTVAMTPSGDVDAAFMGPTAKPIPKERYRLDKPEGRPVRHYHFGRARIADPAHPSAVCFWEDSDKTRVFCWPDNRSAWVQLTTGMQYSRTIPSAADVGRIAGVFYQTDDNRSVFARPPIGDLVEIAGKARFLMEAAADPCWMPWPGVDGSVVYICVCWWVCGS